MTEIAFQVSDGAIADRQNKAGLTSVQIISALQQMGLETFALAIKGYEGENAKISLGERHGADRVIPANTPQEIAEQFGKVLKQAIQDKIAKVMEEALEKAEATAEQIMAKE
jgi:ribosomal protein L22